MYIFEQYKSEVTSFEILKKYSYILYNIFLE